MAKQNGREVLIKIGDGKTTGEGFTNLCGLTSKSLTVNNNSIDVTTADCTSPGGTLWTHSLAGTKSIAISGNGFFEDSINEALINTIAMQTDNSANFELVIPDFGKYKGRFRVTSLEFGGELEGGVTYSISLESTGAVTFTATTTTTTTTTP